MPAAPAFSLSIAQCSSNKCTCSRVKGTCCTRLYDLQRHLSVAEVLSHAYLLAHPYCRSFSRDSLNSSSKQQLGGLSRLLRASRGELGNSFGNLRTQEQQQSGEEQQHQQQQPGCSFAQESSLSGSLPHRACNGTPSKLQQSMQSEATEDHNLNCSSSSAVNLDTDGEQATQNYSRSTTQGGASCRWVIRDAQGVSVEVAALVNKWLAPGKHVRCLSRCRGCRMTGVEAFGWLDQEWCCVCHPFSAPTALASLPCFSADLPFRWQ
jgi:hypothetical protein